MNYDTPHPDDRDCFLGEVIESGGNRVTVQLDWDTMEYPERGSHVTITQPVAAHDTVFSGRVRDSGGGRVVVDLAHPYIYPGDTICYPLVGAYTVIEPTTTEQPRRDLEEPTASDPYRFSKGIVPVDMITALSGLDANKRDSLRYLADHASSAEEFRDSLCDALSLVELIREGDTDG